MQILDPFDGIPQLQKPALVLTPVKQREILEDQRRKEGLRSPGRRNSSRTNYSNRHGNQKPNSAFSHGNQPSCSMGNPTEDYRKNRVPCEEASRLQLIANALDLTLTQSQRQIRNKLKAHIEYVCCVHSIELPATKKTTRLHVSSVN